MKTIWRVLLLLVLLLLTGCASLYAQDYSYVAPYSAGEADEDAGSGIEVKNFAQLKNALNGMVSSFETETTLRFNNYQGSVNDDLAAACYEVKNQTPLGAYGVESLTYTLNRIVSYYTADVSIRYSRSAEEFAAIDTVNGVSALRLYVQQAIAECREDLRFRIYSSTVNEAYVEELIRSSYLDDPFLAADEPTVNVSSYPSEGVNRIYVLRLDYGVGREELDERQAALRERAEEITGLVTEEDTEHRLLALASWLGENCRVQGVEENTPGTAYEALVEGSADSRGVALGYMALCRAMDLDCRIVRGSLGTLGGETHYWNIVRVDDAYYHMDVSRAEEQGEPSVFFLSDEQAWGVYLWDPEAYPSCDGSLQYTDLVPPPEEPAVSTLSGEESSGTGTEEVPTETEPLPPEEGEEPEVPGEEPSAEEENPEENPESEENPENNP